MFLHREQNYVYLKATGLIIISLVFLSFVNKVSWAGSSAKLQLTISLDKSEYKPGEPINADFKLENKGKVALYVNKRFYLNSEEMPKEERELYLVITTPSGGKLPCKFRYETGLPKSDYFVLLEPGKEVVCEWRRDLTGYFDFNEPGVYKVVAVYQNVYGQEIGLDAFKDKVTSLPVSLTMSSPN